MGNIVSFPGMIGPLGLAVSQLLVGSASIRAADDITSPNQLRPVHASASQRVQLSSYRHDDPLTQASSLVDFQNAVWDHLVDCGMDTIAYLPDPESSSVMTNVVRSHSLHRRDSEDSKLPADSSENGRRRLVHVVWLQLIKTIQSTSIERFEDLKAAIKARHPSQYAGENLEALAADYRKDARELTTAGQYDHNLTLTMLKTFLLAGGAGNEDFRFSVRRSNDLIRRFSTSDTRKVRRPCSHGRREIDVQDICRQAEDAYRTQFDRKEWPPASHAPDVRAPSATFGNVATAPQLSIWLPPSHGRPFWLGSPTIFTKLCSATQRSRSLPPFGSSFFLSVFLSTLLQQPPVASTAPHLLLRSLAINVVVSRLLKKSFAPPRFNSGIRVNKLHRSYPLRLRQQGYVASRPPTVAERDDFRHFATLKERALCLQRRADKLRNSRRPATLPPTTGQKGEESGKPSVRALLVLQTPRPSPRTAKYCPVAPANSPDLFALAPLTFHQRAAANKILSHVHLACHSTPLRMALQAPARMREALGPKANTSPIIWDSGASISITPDLSDFEGPVTSPGTITQLKGIAKGLQIKGQGEVTWATYPDETITIEPNRLTLSGVPNDANRGPVTANVNPQNNLPTSEAYNATDPFKAADALVSIVNTVHERNLNLNEAEKELLRWHYRLGHVGFKKVQFILRSGVVSKTEESRRLQTAACRLTSFPKCAACQYGKQHRRPIPGTTPSSVVKDRAHALKTDNLLPGQRISVDHFICSTRGRLLTSAGKRNSTTCIPVVASSSTTPPVTFLSSTKSA
ncbi:hypothetical protein MHU86_7928 [Fragilaria crotonensis]|nr:hypothetical protein MHU86_7928 [Fragilaria crotonensis]